MKRVGKYINLASMAAKKSFIKYIALILLVAVLSGLVVYRFYFQSGPSMNIVLVSIDTLRPDHLGCYGYERNTSPTIDNLAKEGARFEIVASTTSWTLPAHAAMLTSQPDIIHQVLWDDDRLDPHRITIAELLKKQGYRTGAIFTGPYLLPRFGLDQGFDDYIDATRYDKSIDNSEVLQASEKDRTTRYAMDRMEKWLDKEPDKPFFFFLHLFDVHPDFIPPPPYNTMFDPDYLGDIEARDLFKSKKIHKNMDPRDLEHIIALYDGEIRFVDQVGIARLLDMLEKREMLDNTLIIITSDHGEEFFEHGSIAHRNNLYDTTLLVPLIIWRPGLIPPVDITGSQVRLIDIMPTILDMLGMEKCRENTGKSLMPLIKNPAGQHDPRPNIAEITGKTLHMEGLRRTSDKLIYDYKKNKPYYFNLEKDPAEKTPLPLDKNPQANEAARRFQTIRKRALQASDSLQWGSTESQQMSQELRKRLEALGYVE